MLIFRASEFNPTTNFRRILNFNYSFVVAYVYVSYDISFKFIEEQLGLNLKLMVAKKTLS